MIVKRSSSGYAETTSALVDAIQARGLTLFARIDHAAAAREVGMELDDEQVFLFGNPRAGTPLMQSDKRVGIELPLRILVWSEGGNVLLGYFDPLNLSENYDVGSWRATLEQMAGLLDGLATEAAS